MTPSEIVNLALQVKEKHGTSNPKIIISNLNINLRFTPFNKKAVKAYTISTDTNIPSITVNSNFDEKSQRVILAHELGHAVIHKKLAINHFGANKVSKELEEYEANLFAVALLFNLDELNTHILDLSNYTLKGMLDYNITD